MKDPKKIVSLSEREKSMAQDQTQKQLRDMVGGGTNPAPKVREERSGRRGEERRGVEEVADDKRGRWWCTHRLRSMTRSSGIARHGPSPLTSSDPSQRDRRFMYSRLDIHELWSSTSSILSPSSLPLALPSQRSFGWLHQDLVDGAVSLPGA